MKSFVQCFGRAHSIIIGMVHVQALPGSPKCVHSMEEVVTRACQEAQLYIDGKLDGICLENMHDLPWQRQRDLGPETTAAMSIVSAALRREFPRIPIGIQILSSANREALAVAKCAGLNFIRAEGWVYAHIGDEGYTESCAAELTRYRRHMDADHILIFTDIKKKHSSHSLTSDVSLTDTAQAAQMFHSDGVIVTGSATGIATNSSELRDVQIAVKIPVLVGSGVTVDNVDEFMCANALIIGSHFKKNGHWANNIDAARITRFMDKVTRLRECTNNSSSNS